MAQNLEIGERVTIAGEEGVWDVDMTDESFPIIRIRLEGDPAIWKVMNTRRIRRLSGSASDGGFAITVPSTLLFD